VYYLVQNCTIGRSPRSIYYVLEYSTPIQPLSILPFFFPPGPYVLSQEDNDGSLAYLARHFDLFDIMEVPWPRVFDEKNRKNVTFLEGMLEHQFQVSPFAPKGPFTRTDIPRYWSSGLYKAIYYFIKSAGPKRSGGLCRSSELYEIKHFIKSVRLVTYNVRPCKRAFRCHTNKLSSHLCNGMITLNEIGN
jgi:hypothetical protein